jgi:DNA-binding helix-hairpin-helix protein with protein kinase domain
MNGASAGPPSRLVGLGGRRPRQPMLGEGGQGYVYALDDDPDLVIKVFKRPTEEMSARLRALAWQGQRVTGSSLAQTVAWPVELIDNADGEVGGYLMRRYSMPAYHRLETLFTPITRQEAFPSADWKFLAGVARNIASVVASLHNDPAMFVVGDLAPANVVIDGKGYVTLLDSDSMQFTDLRTREVFPSTAVTANYAPPELQELSFPRSAFTDNFALAVIVLQLLLCGEHPFYGQPADGGESLIADNIREARSHLLTDGMVRLPPQALNAQVLPAEIQVMAVRTFREGRLDLRQRPEARQWIGALDRAITSAGKCSAGHTFNTSYGECPWCERLALRLPDPFGRQLPADYQPSARIRAAVPPTATAPAGSWRPVIPPPLTVPPPPPPPPPPVPVPARGGVNVPVLVGSAILVLIVLVILIIAVH